MTLELGTNAFYQRYSEIREQLPLYYCHRTFQYNYLEGGVNRFKTIEKGFYRCEKTNNGEIRVYDTYIGIILSKNFFEHYFKKPSKLRLFLYKHYIWI